MTGTIFCFTYIVIPAKAGICENNLKRKAANDESLAAVFERVRVESLR